MKLFLKTLIMLIGFGGLVGCSTSGYFGNRGRDAADVFTATVGFGVGAKARVGPIQTGALAMFEGVGLRCGCFGGASGRQKLSFPGEYVFIVAGAEDTGSIEAITDLRDKTYRTEEHYPFIATPEFHKVYQGEGSGSRFPYNHTTQVSGFCESYYSQIEVVGALGPSVRLGFNPGELLDFVLGWTTLDIYGDDLTRITPPQPRKAVERVPPPIWLIRAASSPEEKIVMTALTDMTAKGRKADITELTFLGRSGLSLLLDRILPETRPTNEADALSSSSAVSQLGSFLSSRRLAARDYLLVKGMPFAEMVCKAAATGDERTKQEAKAILDGWRKDDSWLFENGSKLCEGLERYMESLSGSDTYAELARRSTCGLLRGLEKDRNKRQVIELCLLQVTQSKENAVHELLLPLLKLDDPGPAFFAMGVIAGRTGNDYISALHMGALRSGRRDLVKCGLGSMPCPIWDRNNWGEVRDAYQRIFSGKDPAWSFDDDQHYMYLCAFVAARDFKIKEARDYLLRLVGGPDKERAWMAIHNLGDSYYEREPVYPELLKALTPHLTSADPKFRLEAVNTLGCYTGEEVLARLLGALQDPEAKVFQKAHERLVDQHGFYSAGTSPVLARLRKAMEGTTDEILRKRIKGILDGLEKRPTQDGVTAP